MPRAILILAVIAAFVYAALCLALFAAQRSFIYYPQPKTASNSGSTLTLNVDGERVLVSTRPAGPDAVIYFGGNAEAVSQSLPTLAAAFPGRSLFANSLLTVAAGQFGFFPRRWLMLDKFESWRYAPKVTAPTQLIAAQNDEVIPASSTEALYKHFPQSRATLTTIPGVDHNSIAASSDYIPMLKKAP